MDIHRRNVHEGEGVAVERSHHRHDGVEKGGILHPRNHDDDGYVDVDVDVHGYALGVHVHVHVHVRSCWKDGDRDACGDGDSAYSYQCQ